MELVVKISIILIKVIIALTVAAASIASVVEIQTLPEKKIFSQGNNNSAFIASSNDKYVKRLQRRFAMRIISGSTCNIYICTGYKE